MHSTVLEKSDERVAFSDRLQKTLARREYKPESPTTLAREFNARFSGSPITVHAARKWLVGEAIPTQEKVRALAQWLGVTPEWLRFGTGEGAAPTQAPDPFDAESARMVSDMKHLDAKDQRLAREFIRMLVRQAA